MVGSNRRYGRGILRILRRGRTVELGIACGLGVSVAIGLTALHLISAMMQGSTATARPAAQCAAGRAACANQGCARRWPAAGCYGSTSGSVGPTVPEHPSGPGSDPFPRGPA